MKKEQKGNTIKLNQSISNIDKNEKTTNHQMYRKKKKLLKTPSHVIRLSMVWVYIIAVFLLSTPYVTNSLYIKEDLSIGTDLSSATLVYATQEEIDQAADELETALNSLKSSGKKSEEYESVIAVSPASFDWKYHISNGIKTDWIDKLITRSKELDREAYTEQTVNAVNMATLKAQQKLCATVTISQSALQIVLGGALNNVPDGDVSSLLVSGIIMYALVLFPVIGFFISTFDKRKHIKNIYSIICSVTCIILIFFAIYPSIGLGAVLSVFLYILLFCLSAGGIYAKQQEDYIVARPELEAEFTEKHPHFVKALINYKSVNLTQVLEKKEQIRKAEISEKSKKNKKRKKK